MQVLLEYNQKQIDAFNQKYGDDKEIGNVFDYFNKSSQRLKNAGYTTDIQAYLSKKWDKEKLITVLKDLDAETSAKRGRLTTAERRNWKPEGDYYFIGSAGGFDIYQPFDVEASVSLGTNAGWCTTGRWKHYGQPEFKASVSDAKRHWNYYTSQGIDFIYLLDPVTHYGKYALVLYNNYIEGQGDKHDSEFVASKNFSLFNAEDVDLTLTASAWKSVPGSVKKALKSIEDEVGIELEIDIPSLNEH